MNLRRYIKKDGSEVIQFKKRLLIDDGLGYPKATTLIKEYYDLWQDLDIPTVYEEGYKEKTLAESVKEIQDWVKEKDFQFPTHEELIKMREDDKPNQK